MQSFLSPYPGRYTSCVRRGVDWVTTECLQGIAGGVCWRLQAAGEEDVPDWPMVEGEPLPGIAEIIDQRRLSGRPVKLLELTTVDRSVVCIWPVSIEQRSLRGVAFTVMVSAGDDFFDYLPLPLKNDFLRFRPALMAVAQAVGADGVLFAHCLPPWGDDMERWKHGFFNRIFDARIGGEGWRFLTRKESLRRHRNRARKSLCYRVEHLHGNLPAHVAEEIAALHRERWAFDNVESMFANPRRAESYAACASRLLTTLIWDGQKLFAAHIGLRFGETLLWHTPVINLRYLTFSPLEVLLLETVEMCEREGIQVIDYGLGDETYKPRFSNTIRSVANFFLPATFRGWLVHVLWRLGFLSGMRQRLALLRARMPFRLRFSSKSKWFSPQPTTRYEPTMTVESVAGFPRLVDVFRICEWPLRREHYERLREGWVFHYQASLRAGIWSQSSAAVSSVLTDVLSLRDPIGDDENVVKLLSGLANASKCELLDDLRYASLYLALADLGWKKSGISIFSSESAST